MTWSWEYNPSEEYLTDGAPEAFIAEVEAKADELVRAAHVLYPGRSSGGGGKPVETQPAERYGPGGDQPSRLRFR